MFIFSIYVSLTASSIHTRLTCWFENQIRNEKLKTQGVFLSDIIDKLLRKDTTNSMLSSNYSI